MADHCSSALGVFRATRVDDSCRSETFRRAKGVCGKFLQLGVSRYLRTGRIQLLGVRLLGRY